MRSKYYRHKHGKLSELAILHLILSLIHTEVMGDVESIKQVQWWRESLGGQVQTYRVQNYLKT